MVTGVVPVLFIKNNNNTKIPVVFKVFPPVAWQLNVSLVCTWILAKKKKSEPEIGPGGQQNPGKTGAIELRSKQRYLGREEP